MTISSLFGTHPRRVGDPFPGSGTSIVAALDQEYLLFDSFVGFTAAIGSPNSGFYKTTAIGASTAVPNDTAGGGMLFQTAAAAGSSIILSTNPEVFSFSVTKRFEMEFSFRSSFTNGGIFMGIGEGLLLGASAATIREDSNVGFLLASDANIQFNYGDTSGNNVLTDTGIDLVAATDTVLTAMYDGRGNWKAYVDGVEGAAITNTVGSHPDALMHVFLGLENTTAAAVRTMTVNYLYLRWEF